MGEMTKRLVQLERDNKELVQRLSSKEAKRLEMSRQLTKKDKDSCRYNHELLEKLKQHQHEEKRLRKIIELMKKSNPNLSSSIDELMRRDRTRSSSPRCLDNDRRLTASPRRDDRYDRSRRRDDLDDRYDNNGMLSIFDDSRSPRRGDDYDKYDRNWRTDDRMSPRHRRDGDRTISPRRTCYDAATSTTQFQTTPTSTDSPKMTRSISLHNPSPSNQEQRKDMVATQEEINSLKIEIKNMIQNQIALNSEVRQQDWAKIIVG